MPGSYERNDKIHSDQSMETPYQPTYNLSKYETLQKLIY